MDRLQDRDREAGEFVRAFFALELDADARASSLACTDSLRRLPGGRDVRWVKPENLHVTLRFLGSVAAARIDALVADVGERIASLAGFELQLTGLTAFLNPRRPRVIAREIAASEPLQRLAAGVEGGIRDAGFEGEDRRFHPHLTLGRIRRSGDFPDVTAADTPPPDALDVTRIVLFRSELHPSGSRYSALARLPLAPAGPTASAPTRPRSPR